MLTMLAPGCNIDAAGLVMSGTSQATPFVAAAIAVMRSKYPTYTPAEVVSALTSTGVQVGWFCSVDCVVKQRSRSWCCLHDAVTMAGRPCLKFPAHSLKCDQADCLEPTKTANLHPPCLIWYCG